MGRKKPRHPGQIFQKPTHISDILETWLLFVCGLLYTLVVDICTFYSSTFQLQLMKFGRLEISATNLRQDTALVT